jgi:3-oxoacyl-(acyl-carrier-protein) synthase
VTRFRERVAITGVGVISAAFAGGADALAAWLAAPAGATRTVALDGGERLAAEVPPGMLERLVDEVESRRLSRVSRLAVAAARLALADASLDAAGDLGLVVGTEFGDLRSTTEFANGYLARGPGGVSALLFPGTVMNTMAAATAIAVAAREASVTLNAPVIAGELAVARAAASIAAGRLHAVLAGGVDQFDAVLQSLASGLGADAGACGEGATFLVLEPMSLAVARGARTLGEIVASRWSALRARPCGVGRESEPRAVTAALADAGVAPGTITWSYTSASGDGPRDAWERRILAAALPHRPPSASLAALVGGHAGLGAMHVAAAAWTARSGTLPTLDGRAHTGTRVPVGPGLVHGVARGGTEVALVVGGGAR